MVPVYRSPEQSSRRRTKPKNWKKRKAVFASEGFRSRVEWWVGMSFGIFGVLVLWPLLAILVGRPWSYLLGLAVILPILFRRQLVLIYEALFTDKWNHLR